MTTIKPVPRETKRLRFRVWEENERDLAAAMEIYTDPEVMRYIGMGGTEDADKVRARLARRRAMFEKTGYTSWAMIALDDATDTPLGSIGLWPINEGPHADARFDPRFTPMVEISYHLPRRSWGKGLAREAGHSVAAFAFGNPPEGLGFDEIVATLYPENLASMRTAEAIGFKGAGKDGAPELMSFFGRDDIVLLRLSKERWQRLALD
jgi:RimJ/RimL family protein N-acetyltransferase